MNLKTMWMQWDARFSSMLQRERVLVAIALIGGCVLIGATLVVEPQFARVALVKKSLALQQIDSERLQAQTAIQQQRLKEDPDASARRELESIKSRLSLVSADLVSANAALVPAAEMNAVLGRILARQSGLRLVGLRNLPPSSFIEGGASVETAQAEVKNNEKSVEKLDGRFILYRHGVEIKLSGSYADLFAYLAQLESDKQKFIWGEIKLSVVEYPRTVLTVVLFTLSTEKEWLAI